MIYYTLSSKTNHWPRRIKKIDNLINQILVYKKKMKLGIFDKYKTTLGQVDHVKKTLSDNKPAAINFEIDLTFPPKKRSKSIVWKLFANNHFFKTKLLTLFFSNQNLS